MRILIRVIIGLGVLAAPAAAQDDSDSVSYVHPDVIVRGSGMAETASRSAAFEQTISGTELSHLSAMPIERSLRRSGLVFIRDRGGRSSVTTVGLRGYEATQTSITLNGFPLTTEQNGLVDLGLYPADIIGRISVIRGAQSALSGSGGIGGSVHLLTNDPRTSSTDMSVGVGSFGSRKASASIPLFSLGIPVSVRVGTISDRSNFPYSIEVSGARRSGEREGNRSRMTYTLVESQGSLSGSTILSSTLYAVDAERGSPGPVSLAPSSDATLYDRLVRGGVRLVTGDGSTLWEADLSGMYQWERYVDRSPVFPYDDSYRTWGVFGSGRVSFGLTPSLRMIAGGEMSHNAIRATTVSFPEGRTRSAMYVSSVYKPFQHGPTLFPSIRVDAFSDLDPIVSAKLAAHQPLIGDDIVSLRFGIGTGFRMPTYNERYWVGGGNPALRHERAMMIEGGCAVRWLAAGPHELLVIAHVSQVSDKIVGWPPDNTDRARVAGGEASWSWMPLPSLELRGGLALTMAESLEPSMPGKQLPYLPRSTASGGVTVRRWGVEISGSVEYASRRYTTMDNDPQLSSEPYTVTSVSCIISQEAIGIPATVTGFVDNVFDRQYEIVAGYPMPGIGAHVTVAIHVD